MKKSNKVNKIIILSIIAIIFTISLVIFILNYTKDDSSFSILEKNWINNHKSNIIDISVYNDIPIYGKDGEGLIFSYLDEFTNAYNIEFNRVSYITGTKTNLRDVAFRILDYNTKLTDEDIEIFKDYYVIVSNKNKRINDISDLKGSQLIVLNSDLNSIKYYLNDGKNIEFVTCESISEMLNLSKDGDATYMVLPNNQYLDIILKNDLDVVYYITEVYKKYVLTVKDKTLRSIMNKYKMIYTKELEDTYKKQYTLNTFFNNKSCIPSSISS